MSTPARRVLSVLLSLAVLLGTIPAGKAAAQEDPTEGRDRTPPRLSFVEGEVSFLRPGVEDWTTAQPNTPLAPGDELRTDYHGNVELQVGSEAFVRAWGDTHLSLAEQTLDLLRLQVHAGRLALDLRRLEPGQVIEVNAPHAALRVDTPGYYRVDAAAAQTTITLRRSGRATAYTATGAAVTLSDGEQAVFDAATVRQAGAPAPDVWDSWNEARTVYLLGAASARHVGPGVAGVAELDRHGAWRVEPEYGAVWVPSGVPDGWAPYTTGRWIADPYYGWTWVDAAPWGWAPYHYGRWVYLNGFWAWAPGPVVVRPVYAPALVAFLGTPGVSVSVVTPLVSWVALGWGEPLVPWWRASRFHGRPWWGGWGGPRVVNNVVIHHTRVVEVHHVTHYRNARIRRAVVGVRGDAFGRRPVHEARLRDVDLARLRPRHDGPGVEPPARPRVERDRRPQPGRRVEPVRIPGRERPDRPGGRERAEQDRERRPDADGPDRGRRAEPGRDADRERRADPRPPSDRQPRVEVPRPTVPGRTVEPPRPGNRDRRPDQPADRERRAEPRVPPQREPRVDVRRPAVEPRRAAPGTPVQVPQRGERERAEPARPGDRQPRADAPRPAAPAPRAKPQPHSRADVRRPAVEPPRPAAATPTIRPPRAERERRPEPDRRPERQPRGETPRPAVQPPRTAVQPPRATAQPPRAPVQPPRAAAQSPRAASQPPRPAGQPPRAAVQPPRPTAQPPRPAAPPRAAQPRGPAVRERATAAPRAERARPAVRRAEPQRPVERSRPAQAGRGGDRGPRDR